MRNLLLARLSPAEWERLSPRLREVEFPIRTVLQEAKAPVEHLDFVETGLASVVTLAGRDRIEVGVIGYEGIVGVPALLGGGAEAPYETFVQVGGSALRLPVAEIRPVLDDIPRLGADLLHFVHVMMVQIANTAVANGRNTVEQRLARWLLMAHDRLAGDEIALTHEFLAVMLGVRRPGVTVALHMLEGTRAVRSRRNSIRILDRERLKAIAGSTYGAPERLYEMLLGTPIAALEEPQSSLGRA